MNRRLFTILSGLSLVLCLATLVLWYRSGSESDTLAHWVTGEGVEYKLLSSHSRLIYWRAWTSNTLSSAYTPPAWVLERAWPTQPNSPAPIPPATKPAGFLERRGFESRLTESPNVFSMPQTPSFGGSPIEFGLGLPSLVPGSPPSVTPHAVPVTPLTVSVTHSLRVPHWFPAVCFAITPSCRLLAIWRRRKRFASSLCQVCGYDLRASAERCPECGTAVRSPAPAAPPAPSPSDPA